MNFLLLNSLFLRPLIAHADGSQANTKKSYRYVALLGDGSHDDSAIIQAEIDRTYSSGGGTLIVTSPRAYYRWPVFVPSFVHIVHTGTIIEIDHGADGRPAAPAYVLGNCREFNRDIVQQRRKTDDRLGNYENVDFEDIPLGTWPEEYDEVHGISGTSNARIRAIDCSVSGMTISAPTHLTDRAFGVWFGNVSRARATNWTTNNLTQPFSLGSDYHPRTPYAVECVVENLHVSTPSSSRTYYGIGFLANANRCTARYLYQHSAVPDNLRDGNMIYANFAKNCVIENFVGNCGFGENGDGVGLQNSSGCRVRNGVVMNARNGISDYYTRVEFLDPFNRNQYKDITCINCENGIKIASKYSVFENIDTKSCKNDLYIVNNNAVLNKLINVKVDNVRYGKSASPDFFFNNNLRK
ncbi:hypothetical protein [Rhizobium rhizoryzae]|uniref:Pectate lyase superfamily protein domain-containing protein n=1 Tax=Rhizobium rhizoryzae TaxID=451876 RepID=A0A7W6LML4_9HYPH|nr:hypothetical protein [Rhizobium rhizoryzae]MBB4146198.1 hypothetical protein [Rhizobium rhizoryzae]